jgi:predicted NAD/FAD-binding protein
LTSNRIAIVGAGWAGLSTAVELAAAGVPVTVFEAAPNLGGRARGFTRNGIQLDNGQHILLGAYRETLRMMRQVGMAEEQALLRLPLRLAFPGHLDLATPCLPAPLHLLAGLLTTSRHPLSSSLRCCPCYNTTPHQALCSHRLSTLSRSPAL